MTSHENATTCVKLIGAAVLTAAIGLAGCGGEPEEVAAAPKATNRTYEPPPPPPPSVTPVSELMAEHGIDERVVLPEDKAPDNTADRIAVLELFDAFARADASSLKSMLSRADQEELKSMVDSGRWEEATKDIFMVEIQTGLSPYNDKCALAVIEVGDTFQPQMWYYRPTANGYEFDSVASPPGMIDRLYGDDWIALWHEILEAEMALANRPDEDLSWDPVDLDDSEDEGGGPSAGGGPSPGTSPGGNPGRGRRQPPRTPRRPPGPGGR